MSMNEIFSHIEGFMKTLDAAVKIAEKSAENSEVKRQNAINMIIGFFKLVGLDLTPYESLIGDMVDIAVFLYNLYGIFHHKPKLTGESK